MAKVEKLSQIKLNSLKNHSPIDGMLMQRACDNFK
jgi:hypothetical protein